MWFRLKLYNELPINNTEAKQIFQTIVFYRKKTDDHEHLVHSAFNITFSQVSCISKLSQLHYTHTQFFWSHSKSITRYTPQRPMTIHLIQFNCIQYYVPRKTDTNVSSITARTSIFQHSSDGNRHASIPFIPLFKFISVTSMFKISITLNDDVGFILKKDLTQRWRPTSNSWSIR